MNENHSSHLADLIFKEEGDFFFTLEGITLDHTYHLRSEIKKIIISPEFISKILQILCKIQGSIE